MVTDLERARATLDRLGGFVGGADQSWPDQVSRLVDGLADLTRAGPGWALVTPNEGESAIGVLSLLKWARLTDAAPAVLFAVKVRTRILVIQRPAVPGPLLWAGGLLVGLISVALWRTGTVLSGLALGSLLVLTGYTASLLCHARLVSWLTELALAARGEQRALLERFRTEQEQAKATRALAAETEQRLRAATSEAEVFESLLEYFQRLIPNLDGFTVFRLRSDLGALEAVFAWGRYAQSMLARHRHHYQQGATGTALAQRAPYVVPDLKGDPLVLHPDRAEPSESGMALPLFTVETPLGALMLTRNTKGDFQEHQVWGASLLAGAAASRLRALDSALRQRQGAQDYQRFQKLTFPENDGGQTEDALGYFAVALKRVVGASHHAIFQSDGEENPKLHLVELSSPCLGEYLQVPDAGHHDPMSPQTMPTILLRLRAESAEPYEVEFNSSLSLGPEQPDITHTLGVPIHVDGRIRAHILLFYARHGLSEVPEEVWDLCRTYAALAGVAFQNRDLFEVARRRGEEYRGLAKRAVSAQETERRRIALDLHDWLVDGMAAPAIHIQLAEAALDANADAARKELGRARELLRLQGEELRRIMKGLHPHLLDQLGLVAALRALAQEFERSFAVRCVLRASPGTAHLKGAAVALTAFRIVQEALNNVAKHSGASEVMVAVEIRHQILAVSIEDNGVGLGRKAIWTAQTGLGLLGMRERSESVGGKFSVTGGSAGGTRVEVLIPLPVQSPED